MIRRDLADQITPYLSSPEAIVITGMRRVGKTTLLKQLHDNLGSANKIWLDFEDINNRVIFEDASYEAIKQALTVMGLDFNKQAYAFLDEAQYVRNLPSVVKYLLDHYAVKFFITGSASFYLKNLFTESLAGRKYLFELFPLTFREFLRFKAPNLVLPTEGTVITKPIHELFAPLFEEFLTFGGFPGVVAKPALEEKQKALEEIFSAYFRYEVEKLADFRKVNVLRDFLLLLMQRTGSRISVSRLAAEMNLSQITLRTYLSFLEGTYFISLVRPFSRSADVEIRKSPKVYFCDTGLLIKFARLGSGQILENAVFNTLRFRGPVNYYQRKSGVEMDFVVNHEEAFEVKQTATIYDQKRLRALSAALGLKKSHLVSQSFTPLPDVSYAFSL